MTSRKRKVAPEPAPESQTASAAIAELKTSIGGQLEATDHLRERVTTLESESRDYATKADLKRLSDSQLEATGGLRERVKALESESKHYATKADLANVKVWAVTGVAGALLSIVIALGVALVRSSFGN